MSRFEKWTIPDSWAWAVMEELGEVIAGGTPSTKEPEYWGGKINWISPSDLSGYSSKFISRGAKSLSEKGLLNSSAKKMPPGSVHFSSRAPIGYVVISTNPMTTNQGFKSLIPGQGVFNEFVYYYLKSAKKTAQDMASGTTFKELSGTVFGQLPVPLPPLNEQKRIVAKIEELFSELDKGIESLKTAREQLKVYRQALLKHAFEGKLTAQWREENKEKLETADALLKRIQTEREQRYQQQLKEWQKALKKWEAGGKKDKKPAKPSQPKYLPPLTPEELADLPQLPEGWAWAKIGNLSGKITDGEHFRPSVKDSGICFLSAKDVKDTGVAFDDPLYIDEDTAAKARLRCDPERNDILIVSRGATVGRMCIVNTDELFCLLGSVILIKVSRLLESKYVLYGLTCPQINRRIVSASGATAQQAIYLRDIQHVPIPLCSLAEQGEIIRAVEEKLTVVEVFENSINFALQQSEALRQSILKKAFSGQLVPQDPNDEPASVLLERIRAEREKETKKAGPKTARRGKA